MNLDSDQLREYILSAKLAEPEKVSAAFLRAKKEQLIFADVLVEDHVLGEAKLRKAQAQLMDIPFVDLSKEAVPSGILQIIPEAIAKKAMIVAFSKKGQDLKVAMINPDDLQTLDFIKKKTGLNIIVHLATKKDIFNVLKQYEKSLKADFGDIIDKDAQSADSEGNLADIAQDLPIVRIVDTLIKHAILQGASDIHIEPLEKEVIVRYRIDGILHKTMTLPKNVLTGIIARIKVLSNLKLDEHRLPQDGRFKIEKEEYKLSFRVSILPVFDGEKVVMRLLDESSTGLTLEKMGLTGEPLEIIYREINKPNGMILVTGPTGSGKTTTLYTIMDILNTPEVNISSVEDPVEYRMDNINQTQVHAKIGMTFAAALRALLRQDPDIIMVGEIRDGETLEIAIHAAMTGHLVLSTLHTNSAAGAVPRMIDMGSQSFLIASTTNVIIAQRLVRRLCGDCREEYTLDKKNIDTLNKSYDMDEILATLKRIKVIDASATWDKVPLYKAIGCGQCGKEGYKGRNGIYEVFGVTPEIQKLITQSATTEVLDQKARDDGMLTMVDDGFAKVVQGITTIEEVMRVTKE